MVTTEIKSGFLHESNKDLIFNCQLQILNLSLFPLGVDSEREDQGLSLYASVGLILVRNEAISFYGTGVTRLS